MAKHKKETKAENEARVLADNVRVLRSGIYGYIYKGKAILQSSNYNACNKFSKHVAEWIKLNTGESEFFILEAAKLLQKEQTLFIPNELPSTKGERIISGGNHYEAVVRQKY